MCDSRSPRVPLPDQRRVKGVLEHDCLGSHLVAPRIASLRADSLGDRPDPRRHRSHPLDRRCGRSLGCRETPLLLTALDAKEVLMGEARDKSRNASQDVKGKAKEAAGKVTGNRKLEGKGKTDQAKASAKK